eukprot:TRINITY_DN11828_c0_g1_i1.p2 TRINITY_DN11828_c0_g1~~TRINITY_DN11828_c0_g1_i1.p2  ORF type:complete len:120 (-),score=24.62 TRINITY_DN11828_c0_g1_i1:169-528(-)
MSKQQASDLGDKLQVLTDRGVPDDVVTRVAEMYVRESLRKKREQSWKCGSLLLLLLLTAIATAAFFVASKLSDALFPFLPYAAGFALLFTIVFVGGTVLLLFYSYMLIPLIKLYRSLDA